MPLTRRKEPFSHPDWLFEIKHDGFRALLHCDSEGAYLESRRGNVFKSFQSLADSIWHELRGRRCVLDGEIVCLDKQGRSQFNELLFRRGDPFFYAFDILWDEAIHSDDEEENRRKRNGED